MVALTGARQTGKTSLIRKLFPMRNFVSVDSLAEASQAESDATSFLRLHPPPLTIDEVQYAPGLFRHIKRWVDANRSLNGQFLLTGSQKFPLMKGISDSLAGRIEIWELDPLSLLEIDGALGSLPTTAVMFKGGFPELYEKPELEPFHFYRSYVATYLERDVRALVNVKRLRDFERFLRVAALRSGQLLNKAELARDVGISPSTAAEWISVLSASNQIVLLEPWFSNRTKSIVKSPKLYFCDTGLLLFLLGVHFEEELLKSPFVGAAWETFVLSELRKRLALRGMQDSVFFWRDQTREVDFLIHQGGRFRLVEAKWAEVPNERDAADLEHVTRFLGTKNVTVRSIACRTASPYRTKTGVEVLPPTALPLD